MIRDAYINLSCLPKTWNLSTRIAPSCHDLMNHSEVEFERNRANVAKAAPVEIAGNLRSTRSSRVVIL
jgi:hypothetical protein